MRRAIALFFGVSSLLLTISLEAQDGSFESLFDGESLRGWEGNADSFRVEDGAIVAGSLQAEIPHNDFLCTTRQFKNFELHVTAKLVGAGKNAGIQFRSQRIPQDFEVKGYQCDMGATEERLIWGSLYDESRRRRFLAEGDVDVVAKAFRENDWNQLRIRCEDKRIRIWLNGQITVDYVETENDIPQRGVIGLQIHGGPPAEAWYKDIKIEMLD